MFCVRPGRFPQQLPTHVRMQQTLTRMQVHAARMHSSCGSGV